MTDSALTGATYDIDGGQQLLPNGAGASGEAIWAYAYELDLTRQAQGSASLTCPKATTSFTS